jgi:hypothetical protein
MTIHPIFSTNPYVALLLPTVCVGKAVCENEKCGALHGFSITICFLIWEVGFGVTIGN